MTPNKKTSFFILPKLVLNGLSRKIHKAASSEWQVASRL